MTVSEYPHGANKSEDVVTHADPDVASHANTTADQQSDAGIALSVAHQKPGGEEPDLALEPDLPSDGRDAVGEAMIRDLPQRPELTEPPSQPNPSSQAR